MKGSMGSATHTQSGYMDRDVKVYLQNHFRGSLTRDYPVAEFIRDVWKFDVGHLGLTADNANTKYKLPEDDCVAFLKGRSNKVAQSGQNWRVEGEACKALQNILNDLASQLPGALDRLGGDFLNLQDRTVQSTYANYKPDFFYTYEGDIQNQSWEFACSAGEVKKTPPSKKTSFEVSNMIEAKLLLQVSERITLCLSYIFIRRMQTYGLLPSDTQNAKRDREDGDSEDDTSNAPFAANEQPHVKKRRTKKPPATEDAKFVVDDDTWNKNRNKVTGYTLKELQLLKYLNELLSNGARISGWAFLVEDRMMSLWYADRIRVIKSVPFDMFTDSHYLLLMVGAHHFADMHAFGLNPLLSLPNDARYISSYDNMTLTLPTIVSGALPPPGASSSTIKAFDEGSVASSSDVQFTLKVDSKHPISTAYGTIGRGTTVIPVEATGDAAKLCGTGSLVAKLAFPLKNREPEDGFIRVIRRKMNENTEAQKFLKHIVDLKCSFTCDLTALGLPDAVIGNVADDLYRCFRALILPELLPLEQVDSPEELQKIVLGILAGTCTASSSRI